LIVIPAHAGIQIIAWLDAGFRRHDSGLGPATQANAGIRTP
jgi:hypothetical protein